jgi:hypothetical protein
MQLESAVSLTPRLSSATPRLASGGFLTTQSEKNLEKTPKKSFDTCKKILHHLLNALTVVKHVLY